ncbi:hypothetical protein [Frankia sp. Cr1]|uniref:hypothetical protein n=1 Tax=Frankia sp. Cr1 TaxID=3073931 RepID=UPI002AD2480C|nr:hypothetical protein [Frankia sp. Cr1]
MTIGEDDEPCVAVFIAHIRAAKSGGPRYDVSMTPLERKSFPNLILLCKRHHEKIDDKDTQNHYTVETLTAWKSAREKGLADKVIGLDRLTEDRLAELLVETTTEFRTEIFGSLDRLHGTSREAVDILKTLVDEPFRRPTIDPDQLASLEHSTRALSVLEDFAPVLARSADAITSIYDHYGVLDRFAAAVAEHNVVTIRRAAEALESSQYSLGEFARAVDQFQAVDVRRIEKAVNALDRGTSNVNRSIADRNTQPSQVKTTRAATDRQVYVRGVYLGIVLILLVQVLALVLAYKFTS